jgi:hypothetical protein
MKLAIGAALGLLLPLLTSGSVLAADLTAAQAVEAVRRHVCFSKVWWADPYVRLGQSAHIDVRIDGRTAYLWSEDMRSVPRVRRWADAYVVVGRSAGPVVIQRSGYNVDLLRGEPALERDRRRAYAGPTQRVPVDLPANCEPRLDPEGPMKAEMKAVLTSSLTNAVRTWGRRPAGGRVRMTVANFNVDYPETFAIRQDTGEVLRIGLISGDRTSYTGGAQRQYVVTPVARGPVAILLKRLIQRYGQTQVIAVR